MRHFATGLSFVVALCLTVVLFADDSRENNTEEQAVDVSPGKFLMETAVFQNGNRSEVYVFDTTTMKLASYTTDSTGIQYLGTRLIEHDLKPKQLDPQGKRYSVQDVQRIVK